MSLAEDEHAVGDLTADGADEPFRVRVGPRASRRDPAPGDTRIGQNGVEGVGELAGPVTDEESELPGACAEIHEQIAGLLGGPQTVGVGGDAHDVNVTGAHLKDEEYVEALQGERAIDVEEVTGQQCGGLHGQEPSPGGVVTTYRCRWDAEALEDPADRGCPDPVAE